MQTFKRITSVFTLILFSWETVVWAAPSVNVSVPTPSSLAHEINIPESIGSVKERFTGPSSPLLIHIQDAHSNPEAQKNIEAILEHLAREKKIRKVAVEGAFGKIEPEILNLFPEPEANEAMAQYLATMGELTGAELFAFHQKDDAVPVQGVDHPELYAKSFQIFQKIKSLRRRTGPWLRSYNHELEKLEGRIFNEELAHFFAQKKSWERDHDPSFEYFKTLKTLALKYLKLELAEARNQFEWPNLSRLLKAEEVESRLRVEAARSETERLARELESKLARGKKRDFLVEGLRHLPQDSNAIPFQSWIASDKRFPPIKTVRHFFEALYDETHRQEISLLNYPNLLTLGGLLILREEIDASGLFEEMKKLEERLEAKLARRPEERKLLGLVKDFSLVEKLLALALSRGEYETHRRKKVDLTPEALANRLRAFEKRRNAPPRSAKIAEVSKWAARFYLLCRERDRALLENTLKLAAGDSSRATVLITGGFHSDGLTALLKEKEISYLVIAPKMTRLEDGSLYEKVMTGKNADPRSLFTQASVLVSQFLLQSAGNYLPDGATPHKREILILEAMIHEGVPPLKVKGEKDKQIYRALQQALRKAQQNGIFDNARLVYDETKNLYTVEIPSLRYHGEFRLGANGLEWVAARELKPEALSGGRVSPGSGQAPKEPAQSLIRSVGQWLQSFNLPPLFHLQRELGPNKSLSQILPQSEGANEEKSSKRDLRQPSRRAALPWRVGRIWPAIFFSPGLGIYYISQNLIHLKINNKSRELSPSVSRAEARAFRPQFNQKFKTVATGTVRSVIFSAREAQTLLNHLKISTGKISTGDLVVLHQRKGGVAQITLLTEIELISLPFSPVRRIRYYFGEYFRHRQTLEKIRSLLLEANALKLTLPFDKEDFTVERLEQTLQAARPEPHNQLTLEKLESYLGKLREKFGARHVWVVPERGAWFSQPDEFPNPERVSIFVETEGDARPDLEALRRWLPLADHGYSAGSVVKEALGPFKLTLYRKPPSRSEARDKSKENGIEEERRKLLLTGQPDVFQGDFTQGGGIPKTAQRIEDLNAGDLASGVKVNSDPFSNMLGRYGAFFKTYIEGIDFGIVGNSHRSSSEIIDVNRNNYNLGLFFDKNRPDLLGLIMFAVPSLIINEILLAIKSTQFSRFPWSIANRFNNLIFTSAPILQLGFGMTAEPNWFFGIRHGRRLSKPKSDVKRRSEVRTERKGRGERREERARKKRGTERGKPDDPISLRGTQGMAEELGIGPEGLRIHKGISKRGTIRSGWPDETGGGERPGEYRRGQGKGPQERRIAIPSHRPGFSLRTDRFDPRLPGTGIPEPVPGGGDIESRQRDFSDAQRSHPIHPITSSLPALSSSLSSGRADLRMVSYYTLKEIFGNLADQTLYEKKGAQLFLGGDPVAVNLEGTRNIFRIPEHPGWVLKISANGSENGPLLREAEVLTELQKGGPLSGVPILSRVGMMKNGGMWLDLHGIARGRGLDSQLFESLDEFFKAMTDAAQILESVHKKGFVHADVNPGNFLINDEREIQLNDFDGAVPMGSRYPEDHHGTSGYSPAQGGVERAAILLDRDTDAFSFILSLAKMIDVQIKLNPSGDVKSRLKEIRDGYLSKIFSPWSEETVEAILLDRLWRVNVSPSLNQRPRAEWALNMTSLIAELQANRTEFARAEGRAKETGSAQSLGTDDTRSEVRAEADFLGFEQEIRKSRAVLEPVHLGELARHFGLTLENPDEQREALKILTRYGFHLGPFLAEHGGPTYAFQTGFELNPNRNRPAIIEKNRAYLESRGWFDPKLDSLGYETPFMLEDEKLPQFMDRLYAVHKEHWEGTRKLTVAIKRMTEELKKLKSPEPAEGKPSEPEEEIKPVTPEEMDSVFKPNIVPLAHLLQMIFFIANDQFKEAQKAYLAAHDAKPEATAPGPLGLLAADIEFSDLFFTLAQDVYMYGNIDDYRARFLFEKGLKFFQPEKRVQYQPEDVAPAIALLRARLDSSDPLDAIETLLTIQHGSFTQWAQTQIQQKDKLSEGLQEHFRQTRQKTLEASQLVTHSGTGVVFGAGSLVVFPLKDLLRETMPDGSLKFRKIVLVELAYDLTAKALAKLVSAGEITKEEAARIEIVRMDATLLFERLTAKIKEILAKSERTERGLEVNSAELSRFLEEIKNLENLKKYALPSQNRFFGNESVNFVVNAMAPQDFASPVKSYLEMLLGFLYVRDDRVRQLMKEWPTKELVPNIAAIILEDAARILQPGGIFFLADVTGIHEPSEAGGGEGEHHSFYTAKNLSELVPASLGFKVEASSTWSRPTNDKDSKLSFTVESLALRMTRQEGQPIRAEVQTNLDAESLGKEARAEVRAAPSRVIQNWVQENKLKIELINNFQDAEGENAGRLYTRGQRELQELHTEREKEMLQTRENILAFEKDFKEFQKRSDFEPADLKITEEQDQAVRSWVVNHFIQMLYLPMQDHMLELQSGSHRLSNEELDHLIDIATKALVWTSAFASLVKEGPSEAVEEEEFDYGQKEMPYQEPEDPLIAFMEAFAKSQGDFRAFVAKNYAFVLARTQRPKARQFLMDYFRRYGPELETAERNFILTALIWNFNNPDDKDFADFLMKVMEKYPNDDLLIGSALEGLMDHAPENAKARGFIFEYLKNQQNFIKDIAQRLAVDFVARFTPIAEIPKWFKGQISWLADNPVDFTHFGISDEDKQKELQEWMQVLKKLLHDREQGAPPFVYETADFLVRPIQSNTERLFVRSFLLKGPTERFTTAWSASKEPYNDTNYVLIEKSSNRIVGKAFLDLSKDKEDPDWIDIHAFSLLPTLPEEKKKEAYETLLAGVLQSLVSRLERHKGVRLIQNLRDYFANSQDLTLAGTPIASFIRSEARSMGAEKTDTQPVVPAEVRSEEKAWFDQEAIISMIQMKFAGRKLIAFADLDTGTGEFVGKFDDLLKKIFARVQGVGVERLQKLVNEAPSKGSQVRWGRPDVEGDYEKAGLKTDSIDIVTINNLESTPEDLISQADRILKPTGLLIVTYKTYDIQQERGIDGLIEKELKERGYLFKKLSFPKDYPHSERSEEADFILIAWKERKSVPGSEMRIESPKDQSMIVKIEGVSDNLYVVADPLFDLLDTEKTGWTFGAAFPPFAISDYQSQDTDEQLEKQLRWAALFNRWLPDSSTLLRLALKGDAVFLRASEMMKPDEYGLLYDALWEEKIHLANYRLPPATKEAIRGQLLTSNHPAVRGVGKVLAPRGLEKFASPEGIADELLAQVLILPDGWTSDVYSPRNVEAVIDGIFPEKDLATILKTMEKGTRPSQEEVQAVQESAKKLREQPSTPSYKSVILDWLQGKNLPEKDKQKIQKIIAEANKKYGPLASIRAEVRGLKVSFEFMALADPLIEKNQVSLLVDLLDRLPVNEPADSDRAQRIIHDQAVWTLQKLKTRKSEDERNAAYGPVYWKIKRILGPEEESFRGLIPLHLQTDAIDQTVNEIIAILSHQLPPSSSSRLHFVKNVLVEYKDRSRSSNQFIGSFKVQDFHSLDKVRELLTSEFEKVLDPQAIYTATATNLENLLSIVVSPVVSPRAEVRVDRQELQRPIQQEPRSEIRSSTQGDEPEAGAPVIKGIGGLSPYARQAVRDTQRVQIWGRQVFLKHDTKNLPAKGKYRKLPEAVNQAITYLHDQLINQKGASTEAIRTQIDRVNVRYRLGLDANEYQKTFEEFFNSPLWTTELPNPLGKVSIVALDNKPYATRYVIWRGKGKPNNLLSISTEEKVEFRIREGAFREISQDPAALGALLLQGLFWLFLREQTQGHVRLDDPHEPGIDVALEILKYIADPSNPNRLDSYIEKFDAAEERERENLSQKSKRLIISHALPETQPYPVTFYDAAPDKRAVADSVPLYLSEIQKGIDQGEIYAVEDSRLPGKVDFDFHLGFKPDDLEGEVELSPKEGSHFVERNDLFSLWTELKKGKSGSITVETLQDGDWVRIKDNAEIVETMGKMRPGQQLNELTKMGIVRFVRKRGQLIKLRITNRNKFELAGRSVVPEVGKMTSLKSAVREATAIRKIQVGKIIVAEVVREGTLEGVEGGTQIIYRVILTDYIHKSIQKYARSLGKATLTIRSYGIFDARGNRKPADSPLEPNEYLVVDYGPMNRSEARSSGNYERISSFPFKPVGGTSEMNRPTRTVRWASVGGKSLKQRIPSVNWGGYRLESQKSWSWVNKILLSFFANWYTSPFLRPLGTLVTLQPSFFKAWINFPWIISSARKRSLLLASEGTRTGELRAIDQFAGEMQGRLNGLFRKRRVTFQNVLDRISALNHLQNEGDRNPRPFEYKSSVTNLVVQTEMPVEMGIHEINPITDSTFRQSARSEARTTFTRNDSRAVSNRAEARDDKTVSARALTHNDRINFRVEYAPLLKSQGMQDLLHFFESRPQDLTLFLMYLAIQDPIDFENWKQETQLEFNFEGSQKMLITNELILYAEPVLRQVARGEIDLNSLIFALRTLLTSILIESGSKKSPYQELWYKQIQDVESHSRERQFLNLAVARAEVRTLVLQRQAGQSIIIGREISFKVKWKQDSLIIEIRSPLSTQVISSAPVLSEKRKNDEQIREFKVVSNTSISFFDPQLPRPVIVRPYIRGKRIEFVIQAPKEVPVHREEVAEAIEREEEQLEAREPTEGYLQGHFVFSNHLLVAGHAFLVTALIELVSNMWGYLLSAGAVAGGAILSHFLGLLVYLAADVFLLTPVGAFVVRHTGIFVHELGHFEAAVKLHEFRKQTQQTAEKEWNQARTRIGNFLKFYSKLFWQIPRGKSPYVVKTKDGGFYVPVEKPGNKAFVIAGVLADYKVMKYILPLGLGLFFGNLALLGFHMIPFWFAHFVLSPISKFAVALGAVTFLSSQISDDRAFSRLKKEVAELQREETTDEQRIREERYAQNRQTASQMLQEPAYIVSDGEYELGVPRGLRNLIHGGEHAKKSNLSFQEFMALTWANDPDVEDMIVGEIQDKIAELIYARGEEATILTEKGKEGGIEANFKDYEEGALRMLVMAIEQAGHEPGGLRKAIPETLEELRSLETFSQLPENDPDRIFVEQKVYTADGHFNRDIEPADKGKFLKLLKQWGWKVGVWVGLDIAASAMQEHYRDETGQEENTSSYSLYKRESHTVLTGEELDQWYETLVHKYPILTLEDGKGERDDAGWRDTTERLEKLNVLSIGDDYIVTKSSAIRRALTPDANGRKAIGASLIKVNQIGTISETLAAMKASVEGGASNIVSHRSMSGLDPIEGDVGAAANIWKKGKRPKLLPVILVKMGGPKMAERIQKFGWLREIGSRFKNRVKLNPQPNAKIIPISLKASPDKTSAGTDTTKVSLILTTNEFITATVPVGTSSGEKEAWHIFDNPSRKEGSFYAIQNFNTYIKPRILELDLQQITNHIQFDRLLDQLEKERAFEELRKLSEIDVDHLEEGQKLALNRAALFVVWRIFAGRNQKWREFASLRKDKKVKIIEEFGNDLTIEITPETKELLEKSVAAVRQLLSGDVSQGGLTKEEQIYIMQLKAFLGMNIILPTSMALGRAVASIHGMSYPHFQNELWEQGVDEDYLYGFKDVFELEGAAEEPYDFYTSARIERGMEEKLGTKPILLDLFEKFVRSKGLTVPVPKFFVIPKDQAKRLSLESGENGNNDFSRTAASALATHLNEIGRNDGLVYGSPRNPLIVSVRAAPRVITPGQFLTVLNVGINDQTLEGLARQLNDPILANQLYAKLIKDFLIEIHYMELSDLENDVGGIVSHLREVAREDEKSDPLWIEKAKVTAYKIIYRDRTHRPFPQDVYQQLKMVINRIPYASRATVLSEPKYHAIMIQRMRFGVGPNSFAGEVISRDPMTGQRALWSNLEPNVQGDMTKGVTQPGLSLPKEQAGIAEQLKQLLDLGEQFLKDGARFEITIEKGVLYLLQVRRMEKNDEVEAAIIMDLLKKGIITPQEAFERGKNVNLELLRRKKKLVLTNKLGKIGKGTLVSPGAASGRVVFDIEGIYDLTHRSADPSSPNHIEDPSYILVKREIRAHDTEALGNPNAQGAISLEQLGAHAESLTRGNGIPGILGGIDFDAKSMEKGTIVFNGNGTQIEIRQFEDYLSIDSDGTVYKGKTKIQITPKSELSKEVAEFLAFMMKKKGEHPVYKVIRWKNLWQHEDPLTEAEEGIMSEEEYKIDKQSREKGGQTQIIKILDVVEAQETSSALPSPEPEEKGIRTISERTIEDAANAVLVHAKASDMPNFISKLWWNYGHLALREYQKTHPEEKYQVPSHILYSNSEEAHHQYIRQVAENAPDMFAEIIFVDVQELGGTPHKTGRNVFRRDVITKNDPAFAKKFFLKVMELAQTEKGGHAENNYMLAQVFSDMVKADAIFSEELVELLTPAQRGWLLKEMYSFYAIRQLPKNTKDPAFASVSEFNTFIERGAFGDKDRIVFPAVPTGRWHRRIDLVTYDEAVNWFKDHRAEVRNIELKIKNSPAPRAEVRSEVRERSVDEELRQVEQIVQRFPKKGADPYLRIEALLTALYGGSVIYYSKERKPRNGPVAEIWKQHRFEDLVGLLNLARHVKEGNRNKTVKDVPTQHILTQKQRDRIDLLRKEAEGKLGELGFRATQTVVLRGETSQIGKILSVNPDYQNPFLHLFFGIPTHLRGRVRKKDRRGKGEAVMESRLERAIRVGRFSDSDGVFRHVGRYEDIFQPQMLPLKGVVPFAIRIKHNHDGGGPFKGGINFVSADVLRNDEEFMHRFNELKGVLNLVELRYFLRKYVKEKIFPLAFGMTGKLGVVGLYDDEVKVGDGGLAAKQGGGKGALLFAEVEEKKKGQFVIASKFTEKYDHYTFIRNFARDLAAARQIGSRIDVPASDAGSDEDDMDILADELLEIVFERAKETTEVSKSKGYDSPSDSLDFSREGEGGLVSIKSRNLSRKIDEWDPVLRGDFEEISALRPPRSTVHPFYLGSFVHYLRSLENQHLPLPQGEWMAELLDALASVTSKSAGLKDHGGSLFRDEATGFGALFILKEVVRRENLVLENEARPLFRLTAKLEGFGKVGQPHALLLAEEGAILQMISDVVTEGDRSFVATAYKEEGFTPEDIRRLINLKVRTRSIAGVEEIIEGAKLLRENAKKRFLAHATHIHSLAAKENSITKDNVALAQADIYLELANGPITNDAYYALVKKGAVVIPDTFANIGGVTVSKFEWEQNLKGERWSRERVVEAAELKFSGAVERVYTVKKEFGTDLRTAVDILAIQEILKARDGKKLTRAEMRGHQIARPGLLGPLGQEAVRRAGLDPKVYAAIERQIDAKLRSEGRSFPVFSWVIGAVSRQFVERRFAIPAYIPLWNFTLFGTGIGTDGAALPIGIPNGIPSRAPLAPIRPKRVPRSVSEMPRVVVILDGAQVNLEKMDLVPGSRVVIFDPVGTKERAFDRYAKVKIRGGMVPIKSQRGSGSPEEVQEIFNKNQGALPILILPARSENRLKDYERVAPQGIAAITPELETAREGLSYLLGRGTVDAAALRQQIPDALLEIIKPPHNRGMVQVFVPVSAESQFAEFYLNLTREESLQVSA